MNKLILLPKLSVIGIRKNGDTYFPYMASGIFSVFVFFVFSSIMHNDIMKTLPHSGYVIMLMATGLVLLGIILIPFLIYTNSFLIKRRKKELGLYSILGLEKKHIGVMLFWETIIIFGIVTVGGIVFGVVLSRLLFLVLLNLARIPVSTKFSFSFVAFKETILFFLVVYGVNLMLNLFEVFKSNPNELMKGAKKGDKEPKYLWITALIGVVALASGYYIAIVSNLDSMIFLNFFLAVALVVMGTHYFFTASTVAVLKIFKKNKKFYYHKSNYVTISGMLYRMKKSASSLANICIFSTMTIITLLCTASLWSGTDSILSYQYPYDIILNFNEVHFEGQDTLSEKLEQLSQNKKVAIKEKIAFTYQSLHTEKAENNFIKSDSAKYSDSIYDIKLIALDVFNETVNKNETLEESEVIIFSTGSNFGYGSVLLNGETYQVKKELDEAVFAQKAVNDTFGQKFYLIVKDKTVLEKIAAKFESDPEKNRIYTAQFQIEGESDSKAEFIRELGIWCQSQDGFRSIKNGIYDRKETVSMNGGLLFIGIFFGIIFSMCLVLIMYYKQISEGFDDRENFNIMQKVGMSDYEVRDTIKRQIIMVFFLPIIVALSHTIAAFGMISKLLGAVNLFDTRLIAVCGIIVTGFFIALYGLSYVVTSKSYYRIVKQMN